MIESVKRVKSEIKRLTFLMTENPSVVMVEQDHKDQAQVVLKEELLYRLMISTRLNHRDHRDQLHHQECLVLARFQKILNKNKANKEIKML